MVSFLGNAQEVQMRFIMMTFDQWRSFWPTSSMHTLGGTTNTDGCNKQPSNIALARTSTQQKHMSQIANRNYESTTENIRKPYLPDEFHGELLMLTVGHEFFHFPYRVYEAYVYTYFTYFHMSIKTKTYEKVWWIKAFYTYIH